MSPVSCLTCGNEFYPKKNTAGHYCSRRCCGMRDKSGAKNPKWRGGRIKMHDGRIAVYAPGHPGANLYKGTHILEYRLIAEKIVGRPLLPNEIVHHINDDPTDNRIENLQVMTQAQHAAEHAIGRRDTETGRFL